MACDSGKYIVYHFMDEADSNANIAWTPQISLQNYSNKT